MPSTTNSLPGYSCGVVRMFSMARSEGLDYDRLADQLLERLDVPSGGPDFQLGVSGSADLQSDPWRHGPAARRAAIVWA